MYIYIMQIFQKLLLSCAIPANFLFLLLLPPVGCSLHEEVKQAGTSQKLSPRIEFYVTVHGLLLWVSMGFIMPVGILAIRMCHTEEYGRRRRLLFYFHVILQILAVLLMTIAAVISFKKFENSFNNNHQRLGLALFGAVWVQVFLGFCKPKRGRKGRRRWYFVHWILGTSISLVGILNIYTGLKAYHEKTSRSVWLWTVLFTAEVIFIAFFYLFQEKWEYIRKQGVTLGNETNIPSVGPSPQRQNHQKDLFTRPCTKSNALGNLFN